MTELSKKRNAQDADITTKNCCNSETEDSILEEPPKKKIEESTLDKLKKYSIVVADTGDFNQIKLYSPEDATTNPSLILQALQKSEYMYLLEDAIADAEAGFKINNTVNDEKNEKNKKKEEEKNNFIDDICDRLSVKFGTEILKLIPGVVSTEINASLSFDTQGSIEKARKIISLYESAGIDRSRVLIKMASTWECFKAAEILEKENIKVNMTLLFSLTQAICAAEANATLISPFVGRILDWHTKKNESENKKIDYVNNASIDPGVLSVQTIYNYYKKFNYKTIVMAASFRNRGEIINLSGCDKLTISPKLLNELMKSNDDVKQILFDKINFSEDIKKRSIDEKTFRWEMNENQMATEKLSEGIRNFNADLQKVKKIVEEKLKEKKNM